MRAASERTIAETCTHATRLTEAGRRYLARIESILENIDVADAHAPHARQTPRGTLRITSPVLFGQYCDIGVRLAQYPPASVETMVVDRNGSMVDEGFDVAVRNGHLPNYNLHANRVLAIAVERIRNGSFLNPERPFHCLQSLLAIVIGQLLADERIEITKGAIKMRL